MENNDKIPLHVSIIMDGNGRWAKERGKERCFGHAEGVESVRSCTEEAIRKGVKYLSLFAFSEENWNRPEAEVNALMELMVKAMVNELPTFLKNGIRFIVLGNRARLDDSLNEMIDECMEKTAGCGNLSLVIFMSYSGRWDILQAAKKLALELAADPSRSAEVSGMGLEDFSRYLVTSGIPDPDLIIRTSGELRISNYLLWQCAYSELYFTDVLWPDFRAEEFDAAIQEYAKRDRRYGKVK
ncbi:MAG: di-trans,poly-cis-decaprenylcistransferase [Bacteroidetes bacterium]|uniref:Isoprenyl transferase n=1 Tax=Candidatus Cryptobacteroides excrementipullorum TaxID=2840761 RepID=A0A9D9ISX9_9BACT|nr:di-trans,poly-cis-decaprenylcistransferase [Candidatus Cryptobacteroides excrementipullorum]